MSSKRKPQCRSIWLGTWSGGEYRCGLPEGHKGQHDDGEIQWSNAEEWRKA